MISNYLKIALRNLRKNTVFSLINILGLTIGITVCMMIFLFITNEFSVDRFHKDEKKIFRAMRTFDVTKPPTPYLSGPYATALLNDYPSEVKSVVRVMVTDGTITYNNKPFSEKRLYFADSGFFKMFSFPLIKGNPSSVLKDPGSVVLSETTARKYFGSEDAIGKVVQFGKNMPLKVTGVMKDIPSNTHMAFDLVIPLSNFYNEDWFKVWIYNNFFTYLLLADNASETALEKRFPQFLDKYMSKDMERMGTKLQLHLTPLSEIYFESASDFDNVKHGNKQVVFIFLTIAVLILVIACINFMNLSTIRAVERSKEVGLRKVLGALRKQLVWQFIGESLLLTFASCILAVILLQLLLPLYYDLLGYPITVSWNKTENYLFLLAVIVGVGFLAGSYPAFVLSAFSPIQALKGKLRLGKGGSFFRQTMVVLQFSISILLIIGTIVIVKQMNYVKNKELGYHKEQTIIIPIDNEDIYTKRNAFKNELQGKPDIAGVSIMSGEPGGFFDQHTFEVENKPGEVWKSRTEFADFEIVNTLGLKIIAGRNLSSQFPTDTTNAVLINRTAAASLGYNPEQAVGKWIRNTVRDKERRTIVGVVEDFNFLSLKEKMDALVISPNEDTRVILVKLNPGNIQSTVKSIETAYNRIAPGYPFGYSFLDEKFNELYKNDIRQQRILLIFSGLAIFIASLGLFGLSSFAAAKRIKEIGVRKVLGSSTENIVVLLSKDLLKPVLLATLIGMPAGYYAMHTWLENFAYRVPLHPGLFVLAAAITIAIALLTVSIRAVRAAKANPVVSLRAE